MIRFVLVTVLALVTLVSARVIAADRIELDTTAIQGSRELPKVLYIVPWKSSRLGALSSAAGSSSFDTSWEALDRDVFRRQVEYYGMLYGSSSTK
jgi:hypothetical protein